MRIPAYQAFVSRKISYHENMVRISPFLHAVLDEPFSIASMLVRFQNQTIQDCAVAQILQLKEKKLKKANTKTKEKKQKQNKKNKNLIVLALILAVVLLGSYLPSFGEK